MKIEFLVNKRSKAKFIYVNSPQNDEVGDEEGRSMLINPEGKQRMFQNLLFEEQLQSVDVQNIKDGIGQFTADQIEALERHLEDEASRRLMPSVPKKEAEKREPRRSSTPRARVVKKEVSAPLGPVILGPDGTPRGVRVQWQNPTLIFYRNRIEPLRANERFGVFVVEDDAWYVMTKDEFQRNFNEVTLSQEYRYSPGNYRFVETPTKALAFRVKKPNESNL